MDLTAERVSVPIPELFNSQMNIFLTILTYQVKVVKTEISSTLLQKLVEVMEFQLSYFKSWKMMLQCCTQYASKFEKLSSAHRTGKGEFSFQS